MAGLRSILKRELRQFVSPFSLVIPMNSSTTDRLQVCLDRLQAGDRDALEELLQHSMTRLHLLVRKMLRGFPEVRRWQDSDDVLQEVLLRLQRTLTSIPVPTVLDYVRLACTQIRRELIDVVRHVKGAAGPNTTLGNTGAVNFGAGGSSNEAEKLAGWGEFHRQIELLSEQDRQLFDLLWYQGLTQEEAATVLKVAVKTVARHWQAARLRLMEAFGGEPPV